MLKNFKGIHSDMKVLCDTSHKGRLKHKVSTIFLQFLNITFSLQLK